VFFSPWQVFILQLTVFVAVAAVFSILAWVGRALTTIPPPKSHGGDRKKSRKHWKNSKDHATQLLAADAARNKAKSAEAGNASLYITTPPRRHAPRRKPAGQPPPCPPQKEPAAATVNKTPP